MKLIIAIAIVASFFLGYFVRSYFSEEKTGEEKTKKQETELPEEEPASARPATGITGLGGIFFKSKNPGELKKWYSEKLGMKMDMYGVGFEWREGFDANLYGFTQWSLFTDKTKYFDPSRKEFMINYRVYDIDEFIKQLEEKGVLPLDSMERTEYGDFIHLIDPEGNKIELWEPSVAAYDSIMKMKAK